MHRLWSVLLILSICAAPCAAAYRKRPPSVSAPAYQKRPAPPVQQSPAVRRAPQFYGGYTLSNEQQLANQMLGIGFGLMDRNPNWFEDTRLDLQLLLSPDIDTFYDTNGPLCVTEGLMTGLPREEVAFFIGKEMCETVRHMDAPKETPNDVQTDDDAFFVLLNAGMDAYAPLCGMRHLDAITGSDPNGTARYLNAHPPSEARLSAVKDTLVEVSTGSDYTPWQADRILIPVQYRRQSMADLSGDAQSGQMALAMANGYTKEGNVFLSNTIPDTAQMVRTARMTLGLKRVARAQWDTGEKQQADDPEDLTITVIKGDAVWKPARLLAETAAQKPVILEVNAGSLPDRPYDYEGKHFILVVGFDKEYLICHDPAAGMGNSRYKLSDVKEAMKGIDHPVVYGFTVPPPHDPKAHICKASELLQGSFCLNTRPVPYLPSKLPKKCDVCKAPVEEKTPSKPNVPGWTKVSLSKPNKMPKGRYIVVKPLPRKPDLDPQDTSPEPEYKARDLVIIDENSAHFADASAKPRSVWLKEFVLTKADLANCKTCKLQITYRSAVDKSPWLCINRKKLGTIEEVDSDWTDYTFNVDITTLHVGKNLLDIETAKPHFTESGDECEMREAILLLKKNEEPGPTAAKTP
jgi:hypothetical protein